MTIFKEANGQFVSGETLSQALKCSRTAIWKHIRELREQGYQFEAVRRSGYRLVGMPDVPYAEQIKAGLKTIRFGRNAHYFDSVESTQKELHALARKGAPEGTLVVADRQWSGKGRLGRSWHSPPGTGIWMSLLLRPLLELRQCPQLTLVAAIAIAETIREQIELPVMVKWPNDLLLDGKKIGGILTELRAESDCVDYIVLGIGINVNTTEFPPELTDQASSLALAKGQPIRRTLLLQRLLEKLENLYQMYESRGFAPLKPRWEALALGMGKPVIVRRVNQDPLEGTAMGLDEDGALLVRDLKGQLERVYSADIEMG